MNPLIDDFHADLLKTVLSYEAMVQRGIVEAHPALMRLDAYRQHVGMRARLSPVEAATLRRLENNAASARRTMRRNEPMQAYYAQRLIVRQMLQGLPLATVMQRLDELPKPNARARNRVLVGEPTGVVESETVRFARLKQIAARPLHRVSAHRYGERGADVRAERAMLYNENLETKEARKLLAQREKELERLAKKYAVIQTLDEGEPAGPALETIRRGAWAAAERRRWASYADRVLEDLATLARLGRPLPTAARHVQQHIPHHLRLHHSTSD